MMVGKADVRDEDLLQRLVAGDEESFPEFYQRHRAGIFRFALHMTDRAEASTVKPATPKNARFIRIAN